MSVINFGQATELVDKLRMKVGESVFGQEDLLEETICCFLSGGHILMTGAPGLAKTTLVRVFGRCLGLEFGRIQFTPDLLPSDIIGAEILNIEPGSGRRTFEFSKGPIFTNLLLADEINRASPRTQSALLEAMQERTSTVSGEVHPLPEPFMVFATQNPFESEGTFPLPEAQLDRFLIHALVDYPGPEAEEQILKSHALSELEGEKRSSDSTVGAPMMEKKEVVQLLEVCSRIKIDQELIKVVSELVRSTRPHDSNCPADISEAIWYGAGPRAGISLISLGKAYALLSGEESVRWSHVKRMAKPALRHRIRLTSQAGRDRLLEDNVVDDLLDRLENRHKYLAKGIR